MRIPRLVVVCDETQSDVPKIYGPFETSEEVEDFELPDSCTNARVAFINPPEWANNDGVETDDD